MSVNQERRLTSAPSSFNTTCGHQSPHAVRIAVDGAWKTFCIGCWRNVRRSRRRREGLSAGSVTVAEARATAAIQSPCSRLQRDRSAAAPAPVDFLKSTSRESDARAGTFGSPRSPAPLSVLPRRPVKNRETRKILFYSHDTFGLGHLRRNLAIIEHMLERESFSYAAMLLTGSPLASSWPMPAGVEVRTLAPVVKVGAEAYVPRDPAFSFAAVKGRREAAILEALAQYQPDVFLVDHAPAGMRGELLPALRLIREEMPRTRAVLGLRDIIDAPETVRGLWREQGIYELLKTYYDQILVYGQRNLFDIAKEYQLSPDVAAKVRYCGYIARKGVRGMSPLATGKKDLPVVLVTVGGGGDGYALLDAYLQALDRIAPDTVDSILVPGPLMPESQRRALAETAARKRNVRIVHTTELLAVLHMADLVVAMAGYNTTAEILAAGKPAILVPRSTPRVEQWLRATLLSRLGLVSVIDPQGDVARRLEELLPVVVANARPPADAWETLDLDGVHRVGEALEDLVLPDPLAAKVSA